MKKEFLKFATYVLLEKVIRLDSYLEEIRKEADIKNMNIISAFSSIVETYKDGISKRIIPFLEKSDELEEWDTLNAFTRLLTLCQDFKVDHESLRWVYTPWASKECYIFLSELLEKKISEKTHCQYGNIFFTEEYNFWCHKVHEDMKGVPEKTRSIVWILPKIEKNNPLMWPMLIHEIGHTISDEYNITDKSYKSLSESSQKSLSVKQKEVLYNWAREISADLIALKFLGPAYLYALISFASVFINNNLNEPSEIHPSPTFRVFFLLEKLKDMGMDYTKPLFEPLNYMVDLFNGRKQLDAADRKLFFKEDWPEHFPSDDMAYKISQEIYKCQDEIPISPISINNYNNSLLLVKDKLNHEILISSMNKSKQKNKEEKIQITNDNMNHYFDLLNEEPCTVGEIINAGCVYHISNIKMGHRHLTLFSKEFVKQYESYLKTLDDILLKSLEISVIHSFYSQK
ncbi:MAG: hypothetical protein FD156_1716 [Nitrospirae bacterium]|nr:MAG: hypothetical protein FD156_1716 [Nitrospirota bacterium]